MLNYLKKSKIFLYRQKIGNFKFLFALIILGGVFLFANTVSAATYYVVPAGTPGNTPTSPYNTWAKAANLPSTVLAMGVAGPDIMYIAPGTYSDYLLINSTNWANSQIIGTNASGSTEPATKGQVWITNVTHNIIGISAGVSGVTIKNISLTGTDSTHILLYSYGPNFIGDNLYLLDSGYYLLSLDNSATNFSISNSIFIGGGTPNIGITIGTSASGTFNSSIFGNSSNKLLSTGDGIKNSGSGNVIINNSEIFGQPNYPISNSGTGSIQVTNSILAAGDNSSSITSANRTAGSITVDHSMPIPNWRNRGVFFTGTVTDTNNIKTSDPGFVRHQRSAFIVPAVDDASNVGYAANTLEPLLSARGLKGSFYTQSSPGDIEPYLTDISSLESRGVMDVEFHTRTHVDLTSTGNIYSITKTGATITIDRAADVITVSPGGTVTGFKSKTLSAIQTELQTLGCTVGTRNSGLATLTLGEIMADSGGAQSSPYSPQILVDTSDATGFFKTELVDGLTDFQSQLGYLPRHLATPSGTSNTNVETAAFNAGLLSLRRGMGDSSNWGLTSLNLYKLAYSSTELLGASDAETIRNIRSIGERLSQSGGILFIVGHNNEQISSHNWELILDTLQDEYPEITITSHADALDSIINSGTWTTADNKTYARTWTDQSNLNLKSTSPAIDAGVAIAGVTTDYLGNHIYGTPDIGAYEYQPPYTISSDLVDPTGSIRIYSDGKYRYTTTTSSTQSAIFSVSPVSGWPSSDYSEYMNVTLDSWQTSGAKNKQWTATSSIATNTIYTIGNLAPSRYYQFKLDGVASTTAITGATCTNGLCLSDSSGNLTFTYTGGYSTHTFALEQNTGAPTNVGISAISADSTTQLTITSQTATDADPGLHSAPYWFNETTGHSGGSSSTDWQTSTSFVDSGLSANTQYTYQVKARDNNLNESAYSDTLSKYTLAPTPTNLSASSNSNSVTLSVESLPNATSGSSGYYFSRSGANSGWIQTNSWTDSGLSCGNEYTYSVKYRNGDGTETSSISTSKSTSGCGGGGSPAMWTLPITPSIGFKLNINGGAVTTSNRNVVLGFNAGTDIKKIAISMTGDFTDASQEDYVASRQWDLCSKLGGAIKNPTCPDGTYKVYAQFYTAYGRTTGNAFASSTIILKSGSTTTENLQINNLPFTNSFTKYMQYRQTNADIKRLQIFLNSDPDTKIAVTGAGSPGKETNYFGLLTYRAVIKFQEKYAKDVLVPWGFVKGTGHVGKTTLAKINELIKK